MKNAVVFLLVLFVGCSSLQTIESVPEPNIELGDRSHLDDKSKILYEVSNDEKNLHVMFRTTERASIIKILQTGFTVYFNTKGKKKKDISIQYPLPQDMETFRQSMMSEMKQGGQQPQLDINKLLGMISHMSIYSYFGEEENINLYSNSSDIKVSVKSIQQDELTYDLIIPFTRIFKDETIDVSKLTVGFVSGKMEIPSTGGGMSGGGGMRGGGMSGGGMSGGGMGGGGGMRGGGKSGGGMSGGSNMSGLTSPIEFWKNVVLNIQD
ncbi:MAG: hypothetical protein KAQ79_11295 [Cyclobacteriaceae bacterium]|nr:hypothetical protein [Cyclobacteriaceae bacterium]